MFWSSLAYEGLSLLVAILALVVVWRLTRAAVRGLSSAFRGTNVSATATLATMAVSLILLPSVAKSVWWLFTQPVSYVMAEGPGRLESAYEGGLRACGEYRPPGTGGGEETINSACASSVSLALLHAWGDIGAGMLRSDYVSSFSWRDFLLFLSVWVVMLFGFGRSADPAAVQGRSSAVGRWLGRQTALQRKSLGLYAVLGLGTYLSVAAIAAIPMLRVGSEPQELTTQHLRERLEAAVLPDSEWNQILPANVSGPDPLAELRNAVEGGATTPSEARTLGEHATPVRQSSDTSQVYGWWLRASRAQLAYLQGARDQVYTAARRLRAGAPKRQDDAKQLALTTYESATVGRPSGQRETVEHFLDIVHWYADVQDRTRSQLGDCASSLTLIDGMLSGLAQDQLAQRPVQGAETSGFGAPAYGGTSLPTQAAVSAVGLPCMRPRFTDADIPGRRSLGSDLGPFSLVARWLVATESLPLALIAGLLGFGLVGSACSTVVRQGPARKAGDPVVVDLPGVIIRGLSAAVVVFLSVEGGLAVFATSTPEPSPYVLLLTCLVAAVFSEDVWDWAHDKLRERFEKRDAQVAKGAGTDASQVQSSGHVDAETP
jgi:hypothetical protein